MLAVNLKLPNALSDKNKSAILIAIAGHNADRLVSVLLLFFGNTSASLSKSIRILSVFEGFCGTVTEPIMSGLAISICQRLASLWAVALKAENCWPEPMSFSVFSVTVANSDNDDFPSVSCCPAQTTH